MVSWRLLPPLGLVDPKDILGSHHDLLVKFGNHFIKGATSKGLMIMY